MNLDFGPAAEALRIEVRVWLKDNWKPEDAKARRDQLPEFRNRSDDFSKKLGKKGWLGIGWPKEYGGLGKNYIEQLAFHEEMGYNRAPMGKHLMAVNIVGPTLMKVGSEYLKKEYLPRILRGEIQTCIGYSEPHAGSDLASLETRAVEDGDDYVINGTKMWTTGAQDSQICFMGARTDPDKAKHKGVSLFIIPMETPGITIRPIECLGGLRTNQTFWENVRVNKRQMVGERGMGFYNIAVALDFERVMIGSHVAGYRRTYDDLVKLCRQTKLDGRPVLSDPIVRNRLADIATDLHVARLLTFKVMWMIDNGQVPNYEASMTKVLSSELQVRMVHTSMSLLGPTGALYEGSKHAPLDGQLTWIYESSLLGTIGGGANEIQRNIIAQRGLGMPR
ncbi:MAG: acyl-CoA dehydrogenase [Chloroflexi bacterium]|nr:acyl-CoA dehydrogenase [Chloroflexota bacterium]